MVFNQSHKETNSRFLLIIIFYEMKLSSLRVDMKEGIESGTKCCEVGAGLGRVSQVWSFGSDGGRKW